MAHLTPWWNISPHFSSVCHFFAKQLSPVRAPKSILLLLLALALDLLSTLAKVPEEVVKLVGLLGGVDIILLLKQRKKENNGQSSIL